MNTLRIVLTEDEMSSLLFLTNGNNVVRAKDMITYFPEFIGEELVDLVRESNLIEFTTC